MHIDDYRVTLRPHDLEWRSDQPLTAGRTRELRYSMGRVDSDLNDYSIVVLILWEQGETVGRPVAAYVERLLTGHPNDVDATWERVDGHPLSQVSRPEDAAAERDAMRIWLSHACACLYQLGTLDAKELPGAVERMHKELHLGDTQRRATSALATLYVEIGRHERVRIAADLAAVTAVLPALLDAIKGWGGNTDLADQVNHLRARLNEHYQGKPFGAALIDALTFYAEGGADDGARARHALGRA